MSVNFDSWERLGFNYAAGEIDTLDAIKRAGDPASMSEEKKKVVADMRDRWMIGDVARRLLKAANKSDEAAIEAALHSARLVRQSAKPGTTRLLDGQKVRTKAQHDLWTAAKVAWSRLVAKAFPKPEKAKEAAKPAAATNVAATPENAPEAAAGAPEAHGARDTGTIEKEAMPLPPLREFADVGDYLHFWRDEAARLYSLRQRNAKTEAKDRVAKAIGQAVIDFHAAVKAALDAAK